MKILIIAENFKTGGLETQITGFCRYLRNSGHEVHFISGVGGRTFPLREIINDNILEVDMRPDLATKDAIGSMNRIISYAKVIEPDILHLHPFTSIIYGGIASAVLRKPYVVTLHGPISLTYSYNAIYRLLLEIILKDAWKVFCVSKEVSQRLKSAIPTCRHVILPNGIDVDRFKPATYTSDGAVALVSRLDYDKFPGIKHFLTLWASLPDEVRNPVHIFGEGNACRELETWLDEEFGRPDWISLKGHEDNLQEVLASGYSAVAGMGRVILESLSMQLLAILIGYDGTKGVVTLNNIEEIAHRNFSGRYLANIEEVRDDNGGEASTGEQGGGKNISTSGNRSEGNTISKIATLSFDWDKLSKGAIRLVRDQKIVDKGTEKVSLRKWVEENANENIILPRYIKEIQHHRIKKYWWSEALLSSIGEADDILLFGDKLLHCLLNNLPQDKTNHHRVNLYLTDKITKTIKEKNELSSQVAQVTSEKDNIWNQLNQTIAEKDSIWNHLNQVIAERDALSSQVAQVTSEKDNIWNQLSQTIAEKDGIWNQLNNIYLSDFWKVASLYYTMRESSILLRSIHNLLKWLKRRIKHNPYPDYLSKFTSYAKRYGIRAAIKKSLLKITGKGFSNAAIPAIESKINSVSEIYGGGVRDRVSVILPVYNQANYLKEAIDGVLNQTYEDIELIVINDGSTDGVEKVLDWYINHPKVKIFTQENQKLPRALNNGFDHATGEFFTWTSADNIMLPNQIEELVNFLKDNPDAHMVFSDYQAIDDRGLALNDPTFRPHNQDKNDRSIMRLPNIVTFENLHDSGDNFIGPSFMYRRYVANVIGDYAHDTFGGEDYDYWLRLNSLFKIKHLDKILYKYRVHADTLNARATELNLFENIRRLLERDRLRREFYKKGFNIIWVGFEQKSHYLALDDKILIIFRYSLKNSSEVVRNLGSPKAIFMCIIDEKMDEYSIDDEILRVSDYIVTIDMDSFDVLSGQYGNKLFNISDVERNLELLLKMANSDLFHREMGLSYDKKPASIYLGDRKLNIAFQVENFDRGGLEQVVYDLATHINREKFNLCGVIVINQEGLMGEKIKSKGLDVLKVGNSLDAYKSLLRNKKIDIVNSHYSYFGLDKASELNMGVIETIHNSYTWLDREKFDEINRINRFMDKHIAVSRQVKNYHRRKFGIQSPKIEVIPNGLNLEGLNKTSRPKFTRNSLGYNESDFIFLNVASFNGIKCHHLMVSALKELIDGYPSMKLIFIGDVLDKGLYSDICGRIKAEGLEGNVKVMDFLDRERLRDIYQMADCFILPSIQEGWSIAAMEAMYFRLPLILTDIGSTRDIVEDNDIGTVVDNPYKDIVTLTSHDILELSKSKSPKNLSELKKAMLKIYKNRESWKEKAKKGREKILNEFTMERMVKRYEEEFIKTYNIDRKTNVRIGEGELRQIHERTMSSYDSSSPRSDAQREEEDFWIHARELNRRLYSNVVSIPQEEIAQFWECFRQILLEKFRSDENGLNVWHPHRYRLILALKALDSVVQKEEDGLQVLEMGEENPITYVLKARYPKANFRNTKGDVRYSWDIADKSIDLIISMEVLEHLQDLPHGIQELYERSGLKAALHEAYRVLKPGGCFFATTPNGASVYHLYKALKGEEPRFCSPHVREYTIDEIKREIEDPGFAIETSSTVHCMTVDHKIDYTEVFMLLLKSHGKIENRGDDLFFLARKILQKDSRREG